MFYLFKECFYVRIFDLPVNLKGKHCTFLTFDNISALSAPSSVYSTLAVYISLLPLTLGDNYD